MCPSTSIACSFSNFDSPPTLESNFRSKLDSAAIAGNMEEVAHLLAASANKGSRFGSESLSYKTIAQLIAIAIAIDSKEKSADYFDIAHLLLAEYYTSGGNFLGGCFFEHPYSSNNGYCTPLALACHAYEKISDIDLRKKILPVIAQLMIKSGVNDRYDENLLNNLRSETVQSLAKYQINQQGDTLSYWAAENDKANLLRLLTTVSTDINVQNNVQDEIGETPMQKIAKALLQSTDYLIEGICYAFGLALKLLRQQTQWIFRAVPEML